MRGLSGVLSIAASLTGCALLWGTGELEFQDQPAAGGASAADGGATTSAGGSGGSSSAGGSAGASEGGSGTGAAGGGGRGSGVGEPCVDPDACAAGLFCADGVCCTSACDGSCEACDDDNDAGTCTPIALWEDPAAECLADGLGCDGAGHCAMCGFAATAPGGASCPAVCDGGCDVGASTCFILCNAGECDLAAVICPADWACEVQCDGDLACSSASIECPADYGCTVLCLGGNEPCKSTTVNCPSNGPCDVTCDNDQCDGAQVNCGMNACTCSGTGAKLPTVACGSSCDCNDGC